MFRHLSKNLKLCGDVISTIGWILSFLIGVFLVVAGLFQNNTLFENTIFTLIPSYVLVLSGFAVALIGMGIFYVIGICVSGLGELVERSNEQCPQIDLK